MQALAPGRDIAATSETLAAITDFRFALVLRESYGWSLNRIEEWMSKPVTTSCSTELTLWDALASRAAFPNIGATGFGTS